MPESAVRALSLESLGIATALFGGFVVFLFIGSRALPGRRVQGARLPSGEVRTYKLNGLALYLLVLALVGAGEWTGWISLAILHAHFPALFVVANVFAFGLTGVLYLAGRRKPDAAVPSSGRFRALRAMFYGVELNPTWWNVDLKMFSYRPSLIGLEVLVLSFASVQYDRTGTLSTAMILYQAFFFVYVFNYFQFEYGMVFTWDIIAERFGWMLVWGDYVLVPFFYCIAGWYVLARPEPLPARGAIGLVALFAFGFWLFRGANEQKHRFKMDPHAKIWGKPAEAIGDRLLVSGFWGIGRHLNYTGEICVYLAFTLTAGFHSFVPYLLPAWLATLLVHRSWRDDERCRHKHGELWREYTRRARFRMIPFVF